MWKSCKLNGAANNWLWWYIYVNGKKSVNFVVIPWMRQHKFTRIVVIKFFPSAYTVNDKSFEGERFRGLLGSSGMQGKVSRFFPSPPSLIHGFPTLQNSYECFNESFAFLTWILVKTVISIYSEMDKSAFNTDTSVCRFQLSKWPAMHSQEEKSYSWSESEIKHIANSFLVSFFCKLLPNLLAETL